MEIFFYRGIHLFRSRTGICLHPDFAADDLVVCRALDLDRDIPGIRKSGHGRADRALGFAELRGKIVVGRVAVALLVAKGSDVTVQQLGEVGQALIVPDIGGQDGEIAGTV